MTPNDKGRSPPAHFIETMRDALFWLEGALQCKEFNWSADQGAMAAEALDRARAATTAFQAEAWQDISTAPKDGTWIELYRPPAEFGWWECLIKARWHQFEDGDAAWAWPDEDYDLTTEEERDRALAFIENGDNYEATDGFTHWRHLTLPPGPKATP